MAFKKISTKKAPRIDDNPTVQLALNRIYDHINELVDSVNTVATDALGEGDGKEGDIRVVKKSDRNVGLEIKVEDGWYESKLFDTNPDVSELSGGTGTGGDVIATISGSGADTNINNNFADLKVKVNEVIEILNDMNISAFKILDRRHN